MRAKMIGLPEFKKTTPEEINEAGKEVEKGSLDSSDKFMRLAGRLAISEAIRLVQKLKAFDAQDDAISEALMGLWSLTQDIAQGKHLDKPNKANLISLYIFGRVNKFLFRWLNYADPKTHFKAVEEGRPTRVKEVSLTNIEIAVTDDFLSLEIREILDRHLNHKERQVIDMRMSGLNDIQISLELGVTKVYVGQIKNKAFAKLESVLA